MNIESVVEELNAAFRLCQADCADEAKARTTLSMLQLLNDRYVQAVNKKCFMMNGARIELPAPMVPTFASALYRRSMDTIRPFKVSTWYQLPEGVEWLGLMTDTDTTNDAYKLLLLTKEFLQHQGTTEQTGRPLYLALEGKRYCFDQKYHSLHQQVQLDRSL